MKEELRQISVVSIYLGACFVVIFTIPVIFFGAPIWLVTLLPLFVTAVSFAILLLASLAARFY